MYENLISGEVSRDAVNVEILNRKEPLVHVSGRVIVKADMEFKNSHTFSDGTKIRLERQYNNFNKRETQPVNAIVISAENIPQGTEILVSHNALHDTNRIFDYYVSETEVNTSDVRYYSLPEYDCFAWRDIDGEFKPLRGYQFGLRVYKPYTGLIEGIEPTLIKDTLYVKTGKLAGCIVGTLKACDYEIIFQDKDGRENRLIRFRHSDEEEIEREEAIYINDDLTEKLSRFELLLGYSAATATTIINHGN